MGNAVYQWVRNGNMSIVYTELTLKNEGDIVLAR
jgi:hypothetical protein